MSYLNTLLVGTLAGGACGYFLDVSEKKTKDLEYTKIGAAAGLGLAGIALLFGRAEAIGGAIFATALVIRQERPYNSSDAQLLAALGVLGGMIGVRILHLNGVRFPV